MVAAKPVASPSAILVQRPSGRLVGRIAVQRRYLAPVGRGPAKILASSSPEKGSSDADAFLESPLGRFVSWLGNSLNASKLNEGKVKFAILQAGNYDEAAVCKQMEEAISTNKITVFSFSSCPFCVKAKALLDDLEVEYKALELDQIDGGYAIRAELAKKTGRTSMPNIFIAGQGIGGCNDGPGIMTLYREGDLLPMLEAAGISVKASS